MKTGIFNLSGFHFSTLLFFILFFTKSRQAQVCNSTQTTQFNECIVLQNAAEAAIATCTDYKGNSTDSLSSYIDDCKTGFFDAGQVAGKNYFNSTQGCQCQYTTQNWENGKVNSAFLGWCDPSETDPSSTNGGKSKPDDPNDPKDPFDPSCDPECGPNSKPSGPNSGKSSPNKSKRSLSKRSTRHRARRGIYKLVLLKIHIQGRNFSFQIILKHFQTLSETTFHSPYLVPCNEPFTCSGAALVDCNLFASAASAGYQTCLSAIQALVPADQKISQICEGMLINGGSSGAESAQNDNNCCCPAIDAKTPAIVFNNAPSQGTSWCDKGSDNRKIKNLLIIKRVEGAKKILELLVFKKFRNNGGWNVKKFLVWRLLFNKDPLKLYILLNKIEGNS